VKIGGAKAPVDSGHDDGWDYTDGTHAQVQVYGSWCDKVKQDAKMVEIVYGCAGVVIP